MNGTTIKFDIQNQGGGCFVLRCNGGLSWEDREALAASVDDHIGDCEELRGVVLDLTTVEYVNSAGLGALFQLVRRLRDRSARLLFANVPPTLTRLFKIVGLDTVGEFHERVDAALTALRGASADSKPRPARRRAATTGESQGKKRKSTGQTSRTTARASA